MKFLLSEMTWKDAENAFKTTDVAIIPVGCMHAHGTVCPIGVDLMIVDELAKRVGSRTGAIVVPAVPYGWANFQMDFPGSITVDRAHIYGMIMDVCRSLHKWGIRKLLFLSGHGENFGALKEVIMDSREELGQFSVLVEWWMLVKELDPKFEETFNVEPALSAVINPKLVDLTKAKMRKIKHAAFLPDSLTPVNLRQIRFRKGTVDASLRARDVEGEGESFSQAAVDAMLKDGREILERLVDYLAHLVEALSKVKSGQRCDLF